jgi:hypothetical protein
MKKLNIELLPIMKNNMNWSLLGMNILCKIISIIYLGALALGFYFLFQGSLVSALFSWCASRLIYMGLQSWIYTPIL